MGKSNSWFKILIGYADKQKGNFLLSIIFSVASIVSGIVPFYCFYQILDIMIYGDIQDKDIFHWALIAVGFYLIKVLLFTLSTGLSHTVAFKVLTNIRKKIIENFLHAPLGEIQRLSIGDIKNIIVDKTENIEPPLAHFIPEGAGHVVLPIISFVALWLIDFRVALSSLITLPATLICLMLTFKISGESFNKYNESNAYMNSKIVEYIEGIQVIKAFGKAGISYEKYANSIISFRKFVLEWMASTWITMKLGFALFPSTLLGVLPVSLILANNGAITASQAILAVMIALSMVSSLARLEVFSENIRQMETTVFDLEEYLNIKRFDEAETNVNLDNYDVSLKNVHFTYGEANEKANENNEVLHGINMTLSQGSFTALVGPSGSGKSTIAKLIARFWDVSNGEITIGGKNIKEIPLKQLSSFVSFVTQDNFLFNCSILENIRIGNPDATDEEVKEAARKAQCEEFINKLPQGYDTSAGEAGKQLSGGEKQRVAIARMILKDAPIVILDEATAFTDPENEDKIQKSIASLTKGKTLLVIAHRLSTIKNADTIFVMENGQVIAKGTQEEILKTCPLYERMWQAHIGAKHWAASAQQEV